MNLMFYKSYYVCQKWPYNGQIDQEGSDISNWDVSNVKDMSVMFN